MKKYLIIAAGGKGTRMEEEIPKQFLLLGDKPLLMQTIDAFDLMDKDIEIFVVIPEEYFELWNELIERYDFKIKHNLIKGGETRFQSVKNALEKIEGESLIVVHDGVRPFISKTTLKRSYKSAIEHGSAVPVIGLTDSVRKVEENTSRAIDRKKYRVVQTPQIFKSNIIKTAYEQEYVPDFTDDASVVEAAGHNIKLVNGDRENIKITTYFDLILAESIMKLLKIN